MTPRRLRLLVAGAAVALFGCSVGNQLVSPRSQYLLYRQTRIAPTLEERLAAGNRYLHVAPDGAYAPELQTWFGSAERAYLVRAHDQLPMLNAYLHGLPDGPRISEVRARIEELETAARFAEGREAERNRRVGSIEAGLGRAAAQRKAFVADFSSWVGLLATVRSYGKPLAVLPPELLARLEVQDPSAGCPLDVCEKTFAPRFAIPLAARQLIPREAAFGVEVTLRAGAVSATRLHGRELFSRVGETLDLRPVSFEDPQSRAEAIGRALAIVENALGTALTADGCERPAVAPVVLERSCDGMHVIVTAALDAGNEDAITFGPELAPPAPAASAVPKAGPAPKRRQP